MSRLQEGLSIKVIPAERPFSNFTFVEKEFEGTFPIRRLFSQARSRGLNTIIDEVVPAAGAVADENEEICDYFPDYDCREIRRVSFWKTGIKEVEEIIGLNDQDCLGFAILKRDSVPSRDTDRWHVFESVIVKYDHEHNYLPCRSSWSFRAGCRTFSIVRTLYCQQNCLNKACAQVALRSICAPYLDDPDLTYRSINRLASNKTPLPTPGAGLFTNQIPDVLDGLGIRYFQFNYNAPPDNSRDWRTALPYQRILYNGIESGTGALLAFSMSGPQAGPINHMIPFVGHTFNEDAWSPVAEGAYFRVGENFRYITSDAWMSSFIAHDDNFGSNLCIPKGFLAKENVNYAIGLIPKNFAYFGLYAEIAAADYFYSILNEFHGDNNAWLDRLIDVVSKKNLILRTLPVTNDEYLDHMSQAKDWDFNIEHPEIIELLRDSLPEAIWMVEVSIPDLFSTNQHKIGELLLDGTQEFKTTKDFSLFVMARFPGKYLFLHEIAQESEPVFSSAPSSIQSHTEVLIRS